MEGGERRVSPLEDNYAYGLGQPEAPTQQNMAHSPWISLSDQSALTGPGEHTPRSTKAWATTTGAPVRCLGEPMLWP